MATGSSPNGPEASNHEAGEGPREAMRVPRPEGLETKPPNHEDGEPSPQDPGRADKGRTGADVRERFAATPGPRPPAPGVLDAAMEGVG